MDNIHYVRVGDLVEIKWESKPILIVIVDVDNDIQYHELSQNKENEK